MGTFLNDVVKNILSKEDNLEDVICIVPSNRAARALQKTIVENSQLPVFSPSILSIEAFIEQISGLRLAADSEVLLTLYSIYKKHAKQNAETYYQFHSWAKVLLGDFNEIDRHLLDAKEVYEYLSAIKRMEQWGKTSQPTELIKSYLNFSKLTYPLYRELRTTLEKNGQGYQGMLYRKAVEQLEHYLLKHSKKSHYVIGLNAMNKAEQLVLESLLMRSKCHIFWDLDTYFFTNELYDTAHFIKDHLKKWSSLNKHFTTINSNSFLEKEKFEITGLPKYVMQANYVAQLLHDIDLEKSKTALVLADEALLPIVLNSIPSSVSHLNITMGYPMANTKIAQFLLSLYQINVLAEDSEWYFEDILNLLLNPIAKIHFTDSKIDALTKKIRRQNIRSIGIDLLEKELGSEFDSLKPFFQKFKRFKTTLDASIQVLKHSIGADEDRLTILEQTSKTQLISVLEDFKNNFIGFEHIADAKSMQTILSEVISKESLSFQGNPDKGLQIMGVLETRGLDFDTVIVTSLNEGVLPAGKSNNSFIPYDIKKEFGLPTSKEKDAIYAYHFFRILQRAKSVYLLYNTEPDVLKGGEKSRFILQLLADENLSSVVVQNYGAASVPQADNQPKSIEKTAALRSDLGILAKKGFSASALTEYIKNPYVFYKRYVLGINEPDEVQEQIAHNIFGSIIHDSLEILYRPFLNKLLTKDGLMDKKETVETVVLNEFEKYYPKNSILKGRNYIAFHVIIKYIKSVLDFDAKTSQKEPLKLISIEEKLTVDLFDENNDFLAKITGKLDRLEHVNGTLRIIDYKTGNVTSTGLSFKEMDQVFEEEKYGKAFQLLFYSYLIYRAKGIMPQNALIMPIRQLGQGLLPLKEDKNSLINESTLQNFELGLIRLVKEILTPQTPFKEAEKQLF